ncbi:MAG: benzoate transporter [Hamadaea sp.]|nr:benzoate transporter [Hamadaea sp.]
MSGVAALAACTPAKPTATTPPAPAPAMKLVAFDSCDTLLRDLRAAAKASVQPWGFGQSGWFAAGRAEAATAGDAGAKGGANAPAYSGTNNHEAGADEPDLVKTDGKRIVTVSGNRLRVVDAASRTITGRLTLPEFADRMLLHGDHVLVLGSQMMAYESASRAKPGWPGAAQTRLWLVSLAGEPKIVSTFTVGANLADARLTGSIARVVVRTTPHIEFPLDKRGDQQSLIKENRKVIDRAPLSAWLPEYTSDGTKGAVDCGDVSRPDTYSGASMVTVFNFDLGRAVLGQGAPSAVLADGDTLYGTGPNLYLAHDERWRGAGTKGRTDLYLFDVTALKPVYLAAGSVPGWLLNQYSLSEHEGVLRAATTTGHPWQRSSKSTSSVYALRRDGGTLKVIGSVGGLGKGEQIFAVRFTGPIGYVVTFRRTDPLYTIDLRDPAKPVVTGELKIPGYSAYLHPASADRLIGVGQDADDNGRVRGTQISLFDVSSPTSARRLAQHAIGTGGYSEAEYDPHAFLYWPAAKLLVVPVQKWDPEGRGKAESGALLLRVGDTSLTEVGWVEHEAPVYSSYAPVMVRRSLVIGEDLWTISDVGVKATTLDGGRQLAWLAF